MTGSFPDAAKTTAGNHNISVTYSLADHGTGTGEFKASNYSIAAGAATATLSGTLTAVVPGVPQSLAAGPKSGAAGDLDVTWTAPAAGGGATVSGYRVRWRTAEVGTQGDQDYAAAGSWQDEDGDDNTGEEVTGKTSYTIEGLVAGTAYDVAVAATNSAGTGSFTSAVQATPRGADRADDHPEADDSGVRHRGGPRLHGRRPGGRRLRRRRGLRRQADPQRLRQQCGLLHAESGRAVDQHDVRGQVRASRGAGHHGLHHHQEGGHLHVVGRGQGLRRHQRGAEQISAGASRRRW